jgi:hypothetical protein
MNMRSIAFCVGLLVLLPPPRPTGALDTIPVAYQQTILLMLEADLQLHFCHLKEFSLYLAVHPSEDASDMDATTQMRPAGNPLTTEQELALNDILICRKEAEEAIRSRLPKAEQELSHESTAQEQLKGFVAVWLAAMKVIPRTSLSKDALLARQDDDRRVIGQKQTAIEVELFWSHNRPHEWASRQPPPH